ncbi:MAG TPA: hypothetical protein ENK96_05655 [Desulfobulbaceae bacterium]|nr:hypothetical protein [Desulfobulbaceae bacterium]
MKYMTRSGYSPIGMIQLMEVLEKNGRKQPGAIELMFATHPMSRERLQWAQEQAHSTYARFLSGATNQKRFLEHTQRLRRIKPAIEAMAKANTFLSRKKYSEADGLLDQALRIAPGDYTALVMRAKCKLGLKQTAKARGFALEATRVNPEEAQGHLVSGIAEFVDKKYNPAYQQFDRYDQLLPGNPEITFFKGLCLEGMHRRSDAARHYRAYLQKVRRGKNAGYAYNRLKTWGYIK